MLPLEVDDANTSMLPIEEHPLPPPPYRRTAKKGKRAEKPVQQGPERPAKRRRVGSNEAARPAHNGERRDPEEEEEGVQEGVEEVEEQQGERGGAQEDGEQQGERGGAQEDGEEVVEDEVEGPQMMEPAEDGGGGGDEEVASRRGHLNNARPRAKARPRPPRIEPPSTPTRVAPPPPAKSAAPSRRLRHTTPQGPQRFSSLDPPEDPAPIRRKLRASVRRRPPQPISPTFLEALAPDAPPRSAVRKRTPPRQVSPFAGAETWVGGVQVLRAQSPLAVVRPSPRSNAPGGGAAESNRALPTGPDVGAWVAEGLSPLPAGSSATRASGSGAAALGTPSRPVGGAGSETALNASTGGTAPIASGRVAKGSIASPPPALRAAGISRVPSRQAVNGDEGAAGASSDRAPAAATDLKQPQAPLPVGSSDAGSAPPEDDPLPQVVGSCDDGGGESHARASSRGGSSVAFDRDGFDAEESPSSPPAPVDKGKGRAKKAGLSPPPSPQVRSRSGSVAAVATRDRSLPPPSVVGSEDSSTRETWTSTSPDARRTGGAARPSGVSRNASRRSPKRNEPADLDNLFNIDQLSATANAFRYYRFEVDSREEALATLTPRQRLTIARWKYPSSGRSSRFSGPQAITPLAAYRPSGARGLVLPPRLRDFEGEAERQARERSGQSKRQAREQAREQTKGRASERHAGGAVREV